MIDQTGAYSQQNSLREGPMNSAHLREFLRARPFEPFRVIMSSSQSHLVKHPENVVLTKTKIVIVDPELDSVAVCALLHVTSVEMQQAV